jgi:DNA-binding response OmpR family regulator
MRILVIEDEPKMAKILKKALRQESYAVDIATDGEEGLSIAVSLDYDAAIIDRMLPGIDGLTIVDGIRKAGKQTPIILLTAMGSIADKTSGLDAGADDYMVKPFAIEELLARVRALTRRPPLSSSTVLKIDDLSLDTATREVKRANQSIELTNKESALLEYLMRNPGRPLSKQTLIEHVWDFDADILPNTVEVYVKYLRHKIDKPFKKPLIKTIRGVGYALIPPKAK